MWRRSVRDQDLDPDGSCCLANGGSDGRYDAGFSATRSTATRVP
jgi:hypothetical protein